MGCSPEEIDLGLVWNRLKVVGGRLDGADLERPTPRLSAEIRSTPTRTVWWSATATARTHLGPDVSFLIGVGGFACGVSDEHATQAMRRPVEAILQGLVETAQDGSWSMAQFIEAAAEAGFLSVNRESFATYGRDLIAAGGGSSGPPRKAPE